MFRDTAITVLVLLSVSAPARAAEPDQFTRRFEAPLADSSAEINRQLNELLRAAVDRANAHEGGRWLYRDPGRCERRLYREMRKEFNNHTKSEFMMSLFENDHEDDGIERRSVLKKDSIFAAWKIRDGYLIGSRRADRSHIAFSPVIRVGEVHIGVDKIEHFFGQGWVSFDRKYGQGMRTSRVLIMSSFYERAVLGGGRISTGVYSYADLVANFNGMRFWNDVLQKHPDILDGDATVGPYVIREGGRWKVNPERPIDLRHYVDWGLDEGINCSRYTTRRGTQHVLEALERLAEENPGQVYACPVDADKFEQVREKYGEYSKWLLNTHGITERRWFSNR